MKFKFTLSLLCACAITASAQQGFKDGIEYYRADQLKEAKEILQNTINDPGTDKAEAYYYLGQVNLAQGDVAQAEQDFNKGITANPENPFNYVGLGAVDLTKGNKNGAEAQFKEAKARGKKNAVMLTDIARAYYNADPVAYAKDIEKTLAEAKKANKQCPAIYILEADMMAKDDVGQAVGYYEMASNYDVNNEYPEAYVKYAQVYFPVNSKFAIERLKGLLEKQPNSALAQRELAEKYYQNNQFTMAAQEYGKYIQNPNHFQIDEQRYVGLLNFAENYQKSFDLASDILSRDPGNFYMQRMQFLNQAQMGNNEKALGYARTFFANPKAQGNFVANDYSKFGDVLYATGDTIHAIEAYEQAIQLQPENANRYKDLSDLYADIREYGKSAELMQAYMDKSEKPSVNDKVVTARRFNNAGATETDSLKRVEYLNNALNLVNDVLNENINDKFPVASLKAVILLSLNNQEMTPEVHESFMESLEILDSNPENKVTRQRDYINLYNRLGQYYLKIQDTEKAKEYFNKYLEFDPDNEALRKFVDGLK